VIKLNKYLNTVPAHSFSVKPHHQAIKVPPLFHMAKTGARVTADPAEEPHLRRFRRTNAGGCLKAVHTNDEGIWAGKQTARRSNGPNDQESEETQCCQVSRATGSTDQYGEQNHTSSRAQDHNQTIASRTHHKSGRRWNTMRVIGCTTAPGC